MAEYKGASLCKRGLGGCQLVFEDYEQKDFEQETTEITEELTEGSTGSKERAVRMGTLLPLLASVPSLLPLFTPVQTDASSGEIGCDSCYDLGELNGFTSL
jgi:hypothetical protein